MLIEGLRLVERLFRMREMKDEQVQILYFKKIKDFIRNGDKYSKDLIEESLLVLNQFLLGTDPL